jgi:hypothetical protein
VCASFPEGLRGVKEIERRDQKSNCIVIFAKTRRHDRRWTPERRIVRVLDHHRRSVQRVEEIERQPRPRRAKAYELPYPQIELIHAIAVERTSAESD